jgi:hypothetical protein
MSGTHLQKCKGYTAACCGTTFWDHAPGQCGGINAISRSIKFQVIAVIQRLVTIDKFWVHGRIPL